MCRSISPPSRRYSNIRPACSCATRWCAASRPLPMSLVIESSGRVSPLQYGFPRAWSWGNIKETPLPALAASWLSRDYAAFLALCGFVYQRLVTNDDEPVLNWYQHVFAAAARFSPPQARELRMQTCADVTFDRRKGVGPDPVGRAAV